jgi:hypothetical protein
VLQNLDERQADKGTLLLEIKATGIGLVSDLADLCDLPAGDFEVTKTEEQQPLAVKKFDEDKEGNAIVSERSWVLTLKPKAGLTAPPTAFAFAKVKPPTKDKDGLKFYRYVDADLTEVGESVTLEARYAATGWGLQRWLLLGVAAMVLLLAAGVALVWLLVGKATGPTGPRLPSDINAFTVLQLLERARAKGGLSPAEAADLDADIGRVERFYFADDKASSPDLRAVAEKWVARS